MKQLIDKAAIIAEIDSKKKCAQTLGDNAINSSMQQFYDGMKHGCVDILSFIDTIETKEVDLEKEIKNRIDSLSNLYCYMEDLFNGNEEEGVYPIPEKVTNELFEFAKHFYELGLTQKGE